MAGLPRSGSTLLSALLNQRGDVLATPQTATPDLMLIAHRDLTESEPYRLGWTAQRDSLVKNLLPALYAQVPRAMIIDKSRMWAMPYYRRVLEEALEEPPRVILPVRPLSEVVASFVRLCRESPENFVDRQMMQDDFYRAYRMSIDDARAEWLLAPQGYLDAAMLGIHESLRPENSSFSCFVEYERLVDDPRAVLREIEHFLGLSPFDYALTGIRGTAHNDFDVMGMRDVHTIRPTIGKTAPPAHTVLSEYIMQKCAREDFWTEALRTAQS